MIGRRAFEAPGTDIYNVYAIRYAYRSAVPRNEIFLRDRGYGGQVPGDMSYYLWLIKGANGSVLVDTGFGRQVAERRNRQDCLIGDPIDAIKKLGVDPSGIRDVVISHLHFDHCDGLDRFPAATFWVQRREMDFWTGRATKYSAVNHVITPDNISELVRLYSDGRVHLVDGAAEVLPGINLHLMGGHSAGLQVVEVDAVEGKVVLATDAAHYYANLESNQPYSIVESVSEACAAFDALRDLAGSDGRIIPGHDTRVMEDYPTPAISDADQIVEVSRRFAR